MSPPHANPCPSYQSLSFLPAYVLPSSMCPSYRHVSLLPRFELSTPVFPANTCPSCKHLSLLQTPVLPANTCPSHQHLSFLPTPVFSTNTHPTSPCCQHLSLLPTLVYLCALLRFDVPTSVLYLSDPYLPLLTPILSTTHLTCSPSLLYLKQGATCHFPQMGK